MSDAPDPSTFSISVVIPIFNESGNIPELIHRLQGVLKGIHSKYEVIFVNDGSMDDSLKILRGFHQQENEIKVISLTRNFGHQQALTAGLDHARGEVIITMDGDLQHPPELIPKLIEKYSQGYDVVNTLRTYPAATGWFKHLSSKFFYKVFNKLSPTFIQSDAADFRLLSRRANNSLSQLRERNRFIRGLVSWIGYRQISIPYEADQRKSGTSKFSLLKMINFGLDALTSFSTIPLYLSMFMGAVVSFLSFSYLIWILYWRLFTNEAIPGWASIVFMVSFLGGIQLLVLGILGEYLGRIYNELKQRPIYLIQEYVGLHDENFTKPNA